MAIDREKFLLLLLQHEGDLRAFIGALVLDRHAREDVFQECALALWRQLDQFDSQRSFGAWARGIATNKILQRRQQDQRFPLAFSPETVTAIRDAYDRTPPDSGPHGDALLACVAELPPRSRELLVLRYEGELSIDEIAARTQRTVDAVYQALSRVRTRLEACIRQRLAAAERGLA